MRGGASGPTNLAFTKTVLLPCLLESIGVMAYAKCFSSQKLITSYQPHRRQDI